MALMIGKKERPDVLEISYKSHPHVTDSHGQFYLTSNKEKYPIKVFGSHNYQNISGAREVLKKLGITTEQFYQAISSFEGAAGRLQKLKENNSCTFYKDFAHAPSKVKATVKAVKEIFPSRDLVACVELHTYSSLNKKFIPQYKDSMKSAQFPVVFFNAEKMKAKNLEPLSENDIRSAFNNTSIKVFQDPRLLESFLLEQEWKNKNLLMMSSGNFGGIDVVALAEKIVS
jgi:UDP-N-acetylmuramate: L-alanyl-gamma-D-glutamyl-meso-diaminopimelate ligase